MNIENVTVEISTKTDNPSTEENEGQNVATTPTDPTKEPVIKGDEPEGADDKKYNYTETTTTVNREVNATTSEITATVGTGHGEVVTTNPSVSFEEYDKKEVVDELYPGSDDPDKDLFQGGGNYENQWHFATGGLNYIIEETDENLSVLDEEIRSLNDDVYSQGKYEFLISKYDDDTHQTKFEHLFKQISDFKQMKVASLLLNYLEQTQKRDIDYIQPIVEIENDGYLKMDVYAKNALELTQTIRAKEK